MSTTAISLAAAPGRRTMVDLDDKQLLELHRAGQTDKMFNEMVRRYHSRLYWVVRRMVKVHEDADDITQDVFVRAYPRIRFGKLEYVCQHWRSWPEQRMLFS